MQHAWLLQPLPQQGLRRRLAQHWVNNIWAKVSTSLFYRTEVTLHRVLVP